MQIYIEKYVFEYVFIIFLFIKKSERLFHLKVFQYDIHITAERIINASKFRISYLLSFCVK